MQHVTVGPISTCSSTVRNCDIDETRLGHVLALQKRKNTNCGLKNEKVDSKLLSWDGVDFRLCILVGIRFVKPVSFDTQIEVEIRFLLPKKKTVRSELAPSIKHVLATSLPAKEQKTKNDASKTDQRHLCLGRKNGGVGFRLWILLGSGFV